MKGEGQCFMCRWADRSELTPGRPLTQHGHRVYVVAAGTSWRFRWALNAEDAKSQAARSLFGNRSRSVPALRVRRVTEDDLVTFAESTANERRSA